MPETGEREILSDLGAQLLHLYVLRVGACGQEDWHRVRTLQAEIARVTTARNAILLARAAATSGTTSVAD